MDFLVLILILSVCLIIFFVMNNKPKNLEDILVNPYFSKKPLTKTEIIFYNKLREALPQYIVLPQVQLASFIRVNRSLIKPNETYKWQNPISQQSVDFLICNNDFSIVAAIELDDKTHDSYLAIKSDNKKTSNIEAAKIPLIRWHAEKMPNQEEIHFEVNRHQIDLPINNENEWTFEPIESMFNPQKDIELFSKNSSLIKPLVFLICILIILIGLNLFSNNISRIFEIPTLNTHSISKNISEGSQDLLKELKQQQEEKKKAEIAKRRSELALQQDFNRRQDLLREEAKREEAIKEDLWNKNFKSKLNCSENDYAVDCGNAYIRARKEFESYWLANKSKYLN
jgi:Ca2+/Na+ antiporter